MKTLRLFILSQIVIFLLVLPNLILGQNSSEDNTKITPAEAYMNSPLSYVSFQPAGTFAITTRYGEKIDPTFTGLRTPLIISPLVKDLTDVSVFTINFAPLKNTDILYKDSDNDYRIRLSSMEASSSLIFVVSKTEGSDEIFYLSVSYGLDYNYLFRKYSTPRVEGAEAELIVEEWNSERTEKMSQFVRFKIGFLNTTFLDPAISLEYYFGDSMNQDFTEVINGTFIQPYVGLKVVRFNLGFNFSF